MLKRPFQVFSENKKFVFLLLLGTLAWSLTMVKSGITYSYGMGFWGPNGHDGVWHIALAKGLAGGTWQMPIFAGEAIKNYHIGFDLILAALHKLTFIPINVLYFQIFPPILAILIGLYSYKFIYVWTKDNSKAWWATFFVYFGGSWGWIINLLRGEEIAGESMFWSQQSVSTLINPPFALSLVFIFSGLYYLQKGLIEKKKYYLILSTFIFGILVQIKIYAGILLLSGLLIAGVWNIWKRKGLSILKVFTGSVIISILLFSPTTKEVGETLIFKPFWFLETMMGFPDRFGWIIFSEAMVNYKISGNWLKGIPAYLVAFLIFWFGNLGSRIVKEPLFFKDLKNIKSLSSLKILIYTVIGVGVLIPTLYVQSGTPWNTVQFMYYSLTFSGILAGLSFVDIVRGLKLTKLKKQLIELLLLLFTLPTTIGVLYYHYLPMRPPAMISLAELEALDFLSEQPDGVVLIQPFDKDKADKAVDNPPRPLYLYESTAYVSAFSGKPVFLEDEVNLEITGYDWVVRKNEVENYFADHISKEAMEFLLSKEIRYVYMVKDLNQIGYEQYAGLSKIFENGEVVIYRVN